MQIPQKISTLPLFNKRSDLDDTKKELTDETDGIGEEDNDTATNHVIDAAIRKIIMYNDGVVAEYLSRDSKIRTGFSAEEMDVIRDNVSKEIAEFEIQVCLEKGPERGILRLLENSIQIIVQNTKLTDAPYALASWIHMRINIGKGSQFILQPLNASSFTCETANGDVILRDMIVVIANSFVMKRLMWGEPIADWIKPPRGWLKLNTFGYMDDTKEAGGVGGVIRDDSGNWLTGFWGDVSEANTTSLQLEALKIGLGIALEIKGKRRIIVEIDHHFMNLEELLEGGRIIMDDDPCYHRLVFECRKLLKEVGKSNYKLQEAGKYENDLVEWLAKWADRESDNMEVKRSDEPPKGLSLDLIESSGLPSSLWK